MTRFVATEMTDAMASKNGQSVKFSFLTESGETVEVEVPPDAIPIITARLSAALEQATQNAGMAPQTRPLLIEKFEVGGNIEQQVIIVSFFPTPNSRIPFALAAKQAQSLSGQIAAAASKVQPQDKKSFS